MVYKGVHVLLQPDKVLFAFVVDFDVTTDPGVHADLVSFFVLALGVTIGKVHHQPPLFEHAFELLRLPYLGSLDFFAAVLLYFNSLNSCWHYSTSTILNDV